MRKYAGHPLFISIGPEIRFHKLPALETTVDTVSCQDPECKAFIQIINRILIRGNILPAAITKGIKRAEIGKIKVDPRYIFIKITPGDFRNGIKASQNYLVRTGHIGHVALDGEWLLLIKTTLLIAVDAQFFPVIICILAERYLADQDAVKDARLGSDRI